MFKANLSFKLLEKYLTLVTEAGFVNRTDANYKLTTSGEEFLGRYKTLQNEFTKLQQSLEALVNEQSILENQCLKSTLCSTQSVSEGASL